MTGRASARDLTPAVIRRTIELAETPGPTGAEQARAAIVLRWWDEDGWVPHTDEVGNIWAQVASGPGPGVLACAHLDTVFPADLPHQVTATPGRLSGPSVGDDSVRVAALSAVGMIGGGEAINARARDAWFDVDLRADSRKALQRLEKRASGILFVVPPGISVEVDELGRRPAGSVAPSSPIARAAVTALRNAGLPREEAAAAARRLPDDFVRKVALAGNRARAAGQIRAALDAGADSVHVFPLGRDRMATVRAFAESWSAAVSAGMPECR